ncbi:MAG: sialidase family protein, partial [Candidatus Poribacteria bacterium]|nr:sialidase family protein [Candidatus Poribacteria bacterium]
MSWHVVDHITIYREEGWYGAHPNVVRTPAGDLLALFHRSPHLGYSHHGHPLFDVRACRSVDEGHTWSPQRFI